MCVFFYDNPFDSDIFVRTQWRSTGRSNEIVRPHCRMELANGGGEVGETSRRRSLGPSRSPSLRPFVVASEKFFTGDLFFFFLSHGRRGAVRVCFFSLFVEPRKKCCRRAILYYARTSGGRRLFTRVINAQCSAASVHGVVFHCKNVVYRRPRTGAFPPSSPTFPPHPSLLFALTCVCVNNSRTTAHCVRYPVTTARTG